LRNAIRTAQQDFGAISVWWPRAFGPVPGAPNVGPMSDGSLHVRFEKADVVVEIDGAASAVRAQIAELTAAGYGRLLDIFGPDTAGLGPRGVVGVEPRGAAGATRTRHIDTPVDITYEAYYFTGRCGFKVMFSLTGVLRADLVLDPSGAVIREIDTQPGTTIEYSSPTTGKSFSFPFSCILQTDYPGGARVGGRAVCQGSGLYDKFPGVHADAGIVYFDSGTVVEMTPDGVPIVDPGPVTRASGTTVDPAAIDAAVCQKLSG